MDIKDLLIKFGCIQVHLKFHVYLALFNNTNDETTIFIMNFYLALIATWMQNISMSYLMMTTQFLQFCLSARK